MKRREAVTAITRTYTVVFEPDPEMGGYVATCPALPGLATQGETIEEARAMAREAIAAYLESLKAHGQPIPSGEGHRAPPVREKITVTLSEP